MEIISRIERAEEELRLAKIQLAKQGSLITDKIKVLCDEFSWYEVTTVTEGNTYGTCKDTCITINFSSEGKGQIHWNGVSKDIHKLGYFIDSILYYEGRDRLQSLVLRKY